SGIVTTAKEVTLDGVTASDTQTTPTQATAFISQRPAGMTETSWVDLLGLDARGNRTTSRPLTEEGYSLGAGVKTRRMRDVLHQDGRPAVSRFDVTTTVLVGGTPTTLSFAQVAAQVGRATYTGTVAAGASVQVLVNVRGATALWGHMARAVDAGTGTGVAYVPASWSLTSAWTEPNTYTITLTNTSGGSIALRDTTVLVSAIPA
ncbi:MAG: hypothetical protein LCH53_14130, partial [Bacteroidetes bacterium]|nr:hypothetical protein [Bacteroidota bacterium]